MIWSTKRCHKYYNSAVWQRFEPSRLSTFGICHLPLSITIDYKCEECPRICNAIPRNCTFSLRSRTHAQGAWRFRSYCLKVKSEPHLCRWSRYEMFIMQGKMSRSSHHLVYILTLVCTESIHHTEIIGHHALLGPLILTGLQIGVNFDVAWFHVFKFCLWKHERKGAQRVSQRVYGWIWQHPYMGNVMLSVRICHMEQASKLNCDFQHAPHVLDNNKTHACKHREMSLWQIFHNVDALKEAPEEDYWLLASALARRRTWILHGHACISHFYFSVFLLHLPTETSACRAIDYVYLWRPSDRTIKTFLPLL